MRKLNVMDGRTDRWTDIQTDGGHCNISRPGPSARWEIQKYSHNHLRVQFLQVGSMNHLVYIVLALHRSSQSVSFSLIGLFIFNDKRKPLYNSVRLQEAEEHSGNVLRNPHIQKPETESKTL